jgi:ribosomal protein L37AE/L43A
MGEQDVKTFITCSKCGKKLIERKKNGVWHFVFGKSSGKGDSYVPVDMYIQGNIKIKCLRRGCGHWQTLSYFPDNFEIKEE